MHGAASQPLLISFLENRPETGTFETRFFRNSQNLLDFEKCAKLNRQISPSVLGFTACGSETRKWRTPCTSRSAARQGSIGGDFLNILTQPNAGKVRMERWR
jgi:hypothetical protein